MAEIESEGELTRSEVADFLREFADELDDGAVVGRRGRSDDDVTDDLDERMTDRPRGDDDDDLAGGETRDLKRITLIVGGDSATVSVPPTMAFDVDVASRSPMLSSGVKQGIEFELSWTVDNPDDLREEWLEVE